MKRILWLFLFLVVTHPAATQGPRVLAQPCDDDEKEALRVLESKGGTLIREGALEKRFFSGPVIGVDLARSKVVDADLALMQKIPKLQILLLPPQTTDNGLVHLAGLRRLEVLTLPGTKITDAGLVHLQELTHLTELSLSYTQVSDAGLASLQDLRDLEKLAVSHTRITDAGLIHLRKLKRLEVLSLDNPSIRDAGLVHLKGLTNLRVLSLAGTKITDDGAAHLQALKQLETLYLGRTPLTDAGMVHLKGMRRLQNLYLNDTRITGKGLANLVDHQELRKLNLSKLPKADAGMPHLQGLRKLESLWLTNSGLSDAGLVPLRSIASLRYLDIKNTKVTFYGIGPLQQKLPKLTLLVSPTPFQDPPVFDIWPGKPADDVGIAGKEKFFELKIKGKPYEVAGKPTKWLTNVTKPTLTVYRPAKSKDTGAAVLIAPGGGYHNLGWDVEGIEIAEWLNSIGVTGIVLKYRCPRRAGDVKGVPPIGPLKDAQRAISLVRSKAKEWGIDPKRIGMAGFSAGGHLVGATCTNFEKRAYEPIDDIDRISCRPDFGIMCYSGYFKVKDGLSPTVGTPADAPPLFFVHASDDSISEVEHTVTFYLALKRAKIDAELHVYATGGHGFGVREGSPCFGWTRTCADWMRNRGFLKSSSKD